MMYPRQTQSVKSSQRGQVLVLGMVMAGLVLIAFTRYFHTGQVVAARARQTHALDAAAYSGALIQARALNMLAYINRTQIGHHVAMAHLVTLGSWAHLTGTEAQQLARGNPPSYLIGMLFGADHGAAYLAAAQATGFKGLAQSGGGLGAAYAAHDHALQHVLSVAQDRVSDSLPDARYAAMQAVLAQNFNATRPGDTDLVQNFDLSLHDDEWPSFLQRYAGQTLRPYLLETSELYRFLAPRDDTARNAWVVDARCPSRRHELRRRGTTQLDADGRWQSVDTQSFHALRSNRWIGCYFREYAMGWGWIPSAVTHDLSDPYVNDPPDNFSSRDFWRWVRDSTTWNISSGTSNPLASSKATLERQRWHGGGLRTFFDTRTNTASSVGFTAKLTHPGPEGLAMITSSAAESFFRRPQARSDQRQERPGLFRPYWQARLSDKLVSSGHERGTP